MRRTLILTCLLSSACAAPEIDTTAATFRQPEYEAHLDECRGGNILTVAAKGAGGMVVGSLYGLFHGAVIGAWAGNGLKGAAVGTAAGAVAGFAGGLYKPVIEHSETVDQCLRGKGYKVSIVHGVKSNG